MKYGPILICAKPQNSNHYRNNGIAGIARALPFAPRAGMDLKWKFS
jgi:hypothetical protein